MMFITLMNDGADTKTTIGGRLIEIKAGENWIDKGTAEFITCKVPNTKIVGPAKECGEDGTPIDEIRQNEILHEVTKEEIKENKLEEVLKPGDQVMIPPIQPPTAPEDKANYEEELKGMTKDKLIEIANFKGIKFAKNASAPTLVKLIIKNVK